MAVTLYTHNQMAYDSVVDMLEENRKACVIHPTGTGKSFIGLRYAADHPTETICWLSPSEYIFKTQLENWKAAGGEDLPNILFYTYARLLLMRPEEMLEIHPDIICVDEFHRLGAAEWGKAFHCLISFHPQAKIMGLTATNIRYLDGQRDMADEIFDGCIASEMTLGEAIVRGILNPPKYVLSMFTYKSELEKYESRVRQSQSKVVRDKGEALLEALRRALDKAEGMDEIFFKHISEKTGKYLVFCANSEHMKEMIGKAQSWFGKVDSHPHIYSAYSADPETSKAFAAFKADESEHLKLLYCIDMLNEGIHVDNISGVILLRPTMSPIIYKQQIGRALSSAQKKDAIIFDIVLNIENLFSIEAVQEEMDVATAYYRSLDMENEIINEHFRVIDEVRDCIELFGQLEDVLTASWDLMYQEAKKYRREYGDLNIPRRYITPEGYSLGRWLNIQRMVRAGKVGGRLTQNQIAQLDTLGMRWDNVSDISWNLYFEAAREYYIIHGNLSVPSRYVTPGGLKLGIWINNLRQYRKSGIRKALLTEERIKALNSIGMQWDGLDYLFERNYISAYEYYKKYGNLNVPVGYVDQNGRQLGYWLARLRTFQNRGMLKLSDNQIERLNTIGMLWGTRYDLAWEKGYEEAECYWEQHGNLSVPKEYISKNGFRLGRWIQRQRGNQKKGKLPGGKKKRLDSLGMIWLKGAS